MENRVGTDCGRAGGRWGREERQEGKIGTKVIEQQLKNILMGANENLGDLFTLYYACKIY